MVPVQVPSGFRQVTVLVPAQNLDHKCKFVYKNFLEKILPFYIVSFFTRKKILSFVKFIVKCDRKNVK
jgi:hypothetical protein